MAQVTKNDIVAMFESEVMAWLPNRNSPSYWRWNVPGAPGAISGSDQLGDPNENVLTSPAQITGNVMSTTVFNMLHNFAMKLTRVRRARWMFIKTNPAGVWTYDSGPGTAGATLTTTLTALNPVLALHFDIPGGQPVPGAVGIDDSDLRGFLGSLRNEVLARRNNDLVAHTITACHIAEVPTPPPCHGSRGRR